MRRLELTEKALRKATVSLTEAANTDYLTGILNRRAFHLEIEKASQAPVEGMFVLLLDIDHFKAINDQYGHDVGDLVLVEVVNRITVNLRPQDLLARWGGEEFLILLKHSDLEAALNVAERIRCAFAEQAICVDELTIPLSISQGIANVDSISELTAAIRLADMRLYQAKQSGRDRVVWE